MTFLNFLKLFTIITFVIVTSISCEGCITSQDQYFYDCGVSPVINVIADSSYKY
jgi:hypothetical protein